VILPQENQSRFPIATNLDEYILDGFL